MLSCKARLGHTQMHQLWDSSRAGSFLQPRVSLCQASTNVSCGCSAAKVRVQTIA